MVVELTAWRYTFQVLVWKGPPTSGSGRRGCLAKDRTSVQDDDFQYREERSNNLLIAFAELTWHFTWRWESVQPPRPGSTATFCLGSRAPSLVSEKGCRHTRSLVLHCRCYWWAPCPTGDSMQELCRCGGGLQVGEESR